MRATAAAAQPDTAAGFDTLNRCTQPVPSFAVYDLFATYRVNKNLDLRVNVQNARQQGLLHGGLPRGLFRVQRRCPLHPRDGELRVLMV